MTVEEIIFQNCVVLFERLESFGFVADEVGWVYRDVLLDGLVAEIRINYEGKLIGQVLDTDLNEPYTAFRTAAKGSFVGQLRESYIALLRRIKEACCQSQLFSSAQANRLAQRLIQTYGDNPDQPFLRYPDYQSYRVAGKWYALFFPLASDKLEGFSGEIAEQTVDVVNLKVAPRDIPLLLAKSGIYPSYHMSKASWVSVVLDGNLSDEVIWDLLVTSRRLVAPASYREMGQPVYWMIPANPSHYDIDRAFAVNPVLKWPQKKGIEAGDWVYIYMTAPYRCLRYACRVRQAHNLTEDGQEEMVLECIERFPDDRYPISLLQEKGVRAVRGPRLMTAELVDEVALDRS